MSEGEWNWKNLSRQRATEKEKDVGDTTEPICFSVGLSTRHLLLSLAQSDTRFDIVKGSARRETIEGEGGTEKEIEGNRSEKGKEVDGERRWARECGIGKK